MKPSPVVSILLFIGTAALLFGLIGRNWSTASGDGFRVKSGPVWGEVCMSRNLDSDSDLECKTHTFLTGEGGWGVARVLSVFFVLFGLSGAVVGGIAGVSLLSKPRSALSLVTLILVGAGFLIMLGLLFYGVAKTSKFKLPEYGFFIWLLGSIVSIVGAIMGMARARGPATAGMPMIGPPPHWAPQQPYGPGAGGYQGGYAAPGGPPGYPQAPGGYPQPQHPAAAQSQPMQPMQAPPQPAQPAAQAGPPHPACGTPATWVAQYNRWFCSRCNQYL